MSEKIVVSCEQGHKFPVNLKKNRYRGGGVLPEVYVACGWFLPRPGWVEEKLKWAENRKEMKAARKRGERVPNIFMPAHTQTLGLLALSQLILKRKREEEKQGE